jgi:acetolactate synthase-1/2/3 large subunit
LFIPHDVVSPTTWCPARRSTVRYGAHFAAGIGNCQMWAAQSCEMGEGQRMLMPGGHSPMGAALCMAIGACFSSDKPCVVIEGDGGFQMNIQEMQTVVRNKLPIKVVVLNNGCLGMLRTFCNSGFAGRLHGAVWGYDVPDFARVASAYDWGGETISRPCEIDAALERLWEDPSKPYVLDVIIPAETYCAPRVPFGKSLDTMIPARPGEPMPPPSGFIVVSSAPKPSE